MSITTDTSLPRLIAIVGIPQSGKSEVQKILHKDYGVQPVDDGHPLRQFAMDHFGLAWEDVHTQEGKKLYSMINDASWQNRKALGELGACIEKTFGEWIMPWMAVQKLPDVGSFSFGSVRRSQPLFYKKHGGVVIEVSNPLARPTGNEWDEFDRSAIDYTIINNGQIRGLPREESLEDLRQKVDEVVTQLKRGAAA
ncbi:MAG: hypothetical protein JJ979_11950 [Roseibium sp.]|nr:hypothetical protein [Roseibium sp.]